jgi:ketosteroid isomerase-like protein
MKNYLCAVPLVLVFCFIIACQDKAAIAELETFKAQTAVEQQNEALVRSVFDRLSKGDEAVYQEMYAPEYGWYFPTFNPKALTWEEEAGFVKLLRVGFPDIRWDIIEMVVSGDRVVARFVVSGTHTGEYQGLLPTGIKVEAGGIWMARIKNGKVVEVKEETDLLGFMQQLGMELKPKEAEKK